MPNIAGSFCEIGVLGGPLFSKGWASFVAIIMRVRSRISGDREMGRQGVVAVGNVWVLERMVARRRVAR